LDINATTLTVSDTETTTTTSAPIAKSANITGNKWHYLGKRKLFYLYSLKVDPVILVEILLT
jgi:hypothetical protein